MAAYFSLTCTLHHKSATSRTSFLRIINNKPSTLNSIAKLVLTLSLKHYL